MPKLPSGTLTFLFTDVQDSAGLWEQYPAEMRQALASHDDLIETLASQHEGIVVRPRGEGDSRFVVFVRAMDGVTAAAAIQQALHAEAWPIPAPTPLRVRMSLHTGEGEFRDGDYYGTAVNRCARLRGLAHGGQTVLSQSTHDLVRDRLPESINLIDLGEHPLKGLARPEHIFQLEVPGLPVDFPPLKSPDEVEDPPAPGKPPYKGLQHFDEADAGLFFGRELLTAKIVRRLGEAIASENSPILQEYPGSFLALIVGASGSGKSSLVRAGLIPALKRGQSLADGNRPPAGSQHWPVHLITPGAHPLESLAISLTIGAESVTAATTLIDDLARDPRGLHLTVRRLLTPSAVEVEGSARSGRLLLIVDQFEEIFTLCRNETERKAFVDNLLTAAAMETAGPTVVVIVLRADFYGHCAQYANLREALANRQEFIGPMTPEELRCAVEEPARLGDWEFEPGLVDLLLQEVGDEPGALPLLSHALLETWKRRRGRVMTFTGYTESGGVRGAIAKTAERVYRRLSPEEQSITRNLFLRLTEIGEGTDEGGIPSPDTRWRVTLVELLPAYEESPEQHAATESVLQTLVEARLITTAEETAEVAHEALIREWPTLREWLNEDREGLRLHRHLTEAAQEWDRLERNPSELYRGARLSQSIEWSWDHKGALNELEQAFLDSSLADRRARRAAETEQQERERLLEQRSRRFLRALVGVFAAAAIIAIVLSGVAINQRGIAEDNALLAGQNAAIATYAQGQALFEAATAAVAQEEAQIQAALAATNAADALEQKAIAEEQREQALQNERLAISRELAGAALNNLEVDPERSVLLALHALSIEHTLEAENALHQTVPALHLMQTIFGHDDAIEDLALSADGTLLVTGSRDELAKVWDMTTGEELTRISTWSTDDPSRVAISPDGKYLATSFGFGSEGGHLNTIVWEVESGQKMLTVYHPSPATCIAFNPDSTLLATTGSDLTAKIWDISSGREIVKLSGHADVPMAARPCKPGVLDAAFSPDGGRLATAGSDGTARVWDIASGKELLVLSGHINEINQVDFSPDGKRLATAGFDGSLRVWDLFPDASESEHPLVIIHDHGVNGVAFSPDGKRLATSSSDGIARIWDATSGKQLISLHGHTGGVSRVAFFPDGTRLVTASEDATIKVWDISPDQEILTLLGNGGSIQRAVFSPDGTSLATASSDGTAQVWDATTGESLLTFSGHDGKLNAIAFSPDKTRLVTGGEDKTAIVWDSQSGEVLLTLTDQPAVVSDIDFSPDGTLLATSNQDDMVRIWSATSGNMLQSLVGHTTKVIPDLAFSPDGTHLASAGWDGKAFLWDLNSGHYIYFLYSEQSAHGVAFGPQGERLAVSREDGTTTIYDISSGEAQELVKLTGHTGAVLRVAFNPDGRKLATAGLDGTARVWDVDASVAAASGVEILTLSSHTAGVVDVAFSPDGKRLVTSSLDGTARVYLLELEELVALAHEGLTRTLTEDECKRYLHMDSCPSLP